MSNVISFIDFSVKLITKRVNLLFASGSSFNLSDLIVKSTLSSCDFFHVSH